MLLLGLGPLRAAMHDVDPSPLVSWSRRDRHGFGLPVELVLSRFVGVQVGS